MTNNVLITGASKGIGLVIAKHFAENNFNVFVTARTAKALEELSKIPNIKGFYPCDLTKDCLFLYQEAKRLWVILTCLSTMLADMFVQKLKNYGRGYRKSCEFEHDCPV